MEDPSNLETSKKEIQLQVMFGIKTSSISYTLQSAEAIYLPSANQSEHTSQMKKGRCKNPYNQSQNN